MIEAAKVGFTMSVFLGRKPHTFHHRGPAVQILVLYCTMFCLTYRFA
jgi:hypothetical protein